MAYVEHIIGEDKGQSHLSSGPQGAAVLGESELPQQVSNSLYFNSFSHSFSTYFLVPIC